DVSNNQLSEVRPEQLLEFYNLQGLDLSKNAVFTLEAGIFSGLSSLSSVKLGSNRYVCDCSLAWLKEWLQKDYTVIKDKEDIRCSKPASLANSPIVSVDFTSLPCADSFISCVTDPENLQDTILLYTYFGPETQARNSCNLLCHQRGQTHYSLDTKDRCLCGSITRTALSEGDLAACTPVCSNAILSRVCNRTVIHTVYPVQVDVCVVPSQMPLEILKKIYHHITYLSLPGTVYLWNFGDGSESFSTSDAVAHYKYSLTGTYKVNVEAQTDSYRLLKQSVEVTVVMPVEQLELECPQVVETRHSIDIWIQTRKGTHLSAICFFVRVGGQPKDVVQNVSSCPRGGQIHLSNLNCYWLNQAKDSWQNARSSCQQTPGGDLVLVNSQDVQKFLQEAFSPRNQVWIGLRNTGSLEEFRWVDGSSTKSFQNWGHKEKPKTGCVQMELHSEGVWKEKSCNQKAQYICEKQGGGTVASLPNVSLFLTGLPVFTGVYAVKNVSALLIPPNPDNLKIELMLFPGLWFSHAGLVASIELVTQEMKQTKQVRFQIFRPYCSPNFYLIPPGKYLSKLNCSSQPLCNTTGGCPSGEQWCHLREGCLPTMSPCSSYAFENMTSNILPIPNPPRYNLPSSLIILNTPKPGQVVFQVLLMGKEIHVYPDDIIVIQHDGKAGSLINCQQSTSSPWRQSYLSLVRSSWWEKELMSLPSSTWVDSVVCDLRVLYTDDMQSFAVTPLLNIGQTDPGIYSYTVTVQNPISTTTATCTVETRTQISGLQIIYPQPVNGKINIPTNQETIIVVKIITGSNATATWSAPIKQKGVKFHDSCPVSIRSCAPACRRDTKDTWFSFVHVTVTELRSDILNVSVSNEISSQNISVGIQSHDVIKGLQMIPAGSRRMLVDVSQVFSAIVTHGTSVTYTWVIDNMSMFAYTGQTYSVIFKRPAIYKLKVIAENPISAQSVEAELTADIMNPLADPEFVLVPDVITVNIPQTFTFGVKVDMSIEVTFRWSFGDGSVEVQHSFSPPYDSKLLQPDPGIKRIYFWDKMTYTYMQPGDYTIRVQAFNNYDRVEKISKVQVYSPLISVSFVLTPQYPLINQHIKLEAYPQPSSYGIRYSWNFNDGSPVQEGTKSTVDHAFEKRGTYNITLQANNSISTVSSSMIVAVGESVTGLDVNSNAPSELGSATSVYGILVTGTNVSWTFDMGDGHIYKNMSNSSVNHIYTSEGNYSVTVIASNDVSSANQSITVEVYKLKIIGLIPLDCQVSGETTLFEAKTTGNVAHLKLFWNFGDGSPPIIVNGSSTVLHSYLAAGSYSINVTVLSILNMDSYQGSICVEDLIASVRLEVSDGAIALGEELTFFAKVVPNPDQQHHYEYQWNFGTKESPILSNQKFTYRYTKKGSYLATVIVSNKISRKNDSSLIIVQKPLKKISITHDSENQAVLALNRSYLFTAEVSTDANLSFTWYFGDGTSKEGQNVTYTYNTTGEFNITVVGGNLVSRQESTLEVVVITPITKLILSPNNTVAETRQAVTFTVSFSTGDQVQYFWAICALCEFQEGTSLFTRTFLKPGTFQIFAMVENAVSKETSCVSIRILEKVQGLQISSEDLILGKYVAAKESFTLSAQITFGSNVTFHWIIYQGPDIAFTGTGQFILYICNTSGELIVELKAKNALGETSQILALQIVERVSGVKVHSATDSVAVRKPANLTVTVNSGSNLFYLWYLESNKQHLLSNVSSVSYIYYFPGSVVVNVTVGNVLGSSNGSTELRIQEPISAVSFTILELIHTFYAPSNTVLQFQGDAVQGTDIIWVWKFPNEKMMTLFIQQEIAYSFTDAAVYQVTLNASNDVSWEAVSQNITVQDCIIGFAINIDRTTTCICCPITFHLAVQEGTEVKYSLNFTSESSAVRLKGDTYEYLFSATGQHLVIATAENNVSTQSESVMIQVAENVKGLHLVNCCFPVIESRKVINFTAEVQSGSNITYRWNFHLPGYMDYKTVGKSAVYTPLGEGRLTIEVEATNTICSVSNTETIEVQVPIASAMLSSNGTNIFVDQLVTFRVAVTGGSDIYYKWSFGDSNKTFIGQNNTVLYKYKTTGDFVVEVKVYNNISFIITQLTVTVQNLECQVPVLQFVDPHYTILRSRTNYFEVNVDLKGCTSYKACYFWQVFRTYDCEDLQKEGRLLLDNVGVVTPFLVLPKLSLNVGTYCLQFTVSLQDTPLQQKVFLNVSVVHSKLVPIIRGGSQRVWSIGLDLVLDGTKSYDPDVGVEEDSSLLYHWHCELQKNVASCCPRFLENNTSITIPKAMLCQSTIYVFTLAIGKPGREVAFATQTVSVWSRRTLSVMIECQSCSALSSYEVSRSIHVTLSGQCRNCNDKTLYKWTSHSSDGKPLILDSTTTSTGDSNRDLVVRQGVLKDGVNYTFTLTATYPMRRQWGLSSITLAPNKPPQDGVCTIQPESIIYVLETSLVYHCTGWRDEDSSLVQLIYTLIAETYMTDTGHCQRFYLYRGIKSSFSTLVPSGNHGNDSTVNIIIEIEDSLGAKTTALNQTLKVLMPELPSDFKDVTDWLKSKTQSELWGVVQQGNPQDVIPYTIALISTLNQVQNISSNCLKKKNSENSYEQLDDRISIRSNITLTLTSLNISTMEDVTQLSAALAQCVAVPKEFVSEMCQKKTLDVTKKMVEIITMETEQGDATPVFTGTSILEILGDMLHLGGSMAALDIARSSNVSADISSDIAVSAFNLTNSLMKSLMRSRVLNEETLSLMVSKIGIQGKKTNPFTLLCSKPTDWCHFIIPQELFSQLSENHEVVQVVMNFSVNPFPFNFIDNYTISTGLASLEFTTPEGTQIPVNNLTSKSAIRVKLTTENNSHSKANLTIIHIPPRESINFTVRGVNREMAAGLYMNINFTKLQDSKQTQEREPFVCVYIHYNEFPNESYYTLMNEITLSSATESGSREVTIFLSPKYDDTTKDYYVNITNHFTSLHVNASVKVYYCLCQYFSFHSMHWSTQGLAPMAVTSETEAVCQAQHLTVFGASLFVPLEAITFFPLVRTSYFYLLNTNRPAQNHIVVITCVILFASYIVMVLIAHKLDYIDINRVGIVPLCGHSGRYKYQVMVKTGWGRGSVKGTTAHVGISLYGLNKSGSRHLDKEGGFQRNSLDVFQIETDANLGEIWKIRIWHDNTGLDPSWFLQHVIVWDKQMDNLYFFLVKDWLSVENEKNEGMVEKEFLAACPQELRHFSRIFHAQLCRGITDKHTWLSIWDRPPRSRFTRAQRITCCTLLLYLSLATSTVWYGAVGHKSERNPVANNLFANEESVAVGIVVSVVVFPVYLLFSFLFRKTRSKVTIEDPDPPPVESQTIEMEVCLDHSNFSSSSFLSIPGGLDSIMDVSSDRFTSASMNFVKHWPSCDTIFDIPDLLSSDFSATCSRNLKRKKALLKLGIESPVTSDDDPLSFSVSDSESGLLSEEAFAAAAYIVPAFSSSVFTSLKFSLVSCTKKGEPSQTECLFEIGACEPPVTLSLTPAQAGKPSVTTLGVPRSPPRWLFPHWLVTVTYLLSFLVIAGCITITILYGASFPNSVVLMWLISVLSSFLSSFFLLEPLKLLVEALFAALVTKPVDPEEDDTLVEEPLIKKSPERISKVRAPCGYGLLQAKEEARKVRALRTLMKNCIVHMLFLLVVLMINYQGCFRDNNARFLYAAVKQSIIVTTRQGFNFTKIGGSGDLWQWMDSVLLVYLYNNPSQTLVGVPRLRQERLVEGRSWNLYWYSSCPPPPKASVISCEKKKKAFHDYRLIQSRCSRGIKNTTKQKKPSFLLAWYWGELGVYSGSGHTRELANNSADTRMILRELQKSNWIDKMSRAVFIEFNQYNYNVNLYIVVTLMIEFPPIGSAIPSFTIQPLYMLRSSTGVDLLLFLMVLLLVFCLCFLYFELLLLFREGFMYFKQGWRYLQIFIILLSAAIVCTHFAWIWLADIQLERYKQNQEAFTSFQTVAFLAETVRDLSAVLLSVLIIKIVRQLRFVRRWSAFGKTFQRALCDLSAAAFFFFLFILFFAQCAYLFFSATVEDFRTFRRAFYSLISILRSNMSLQRVTEMYPVLGPIFFSSYIMCLLWITRHFFTAIIIHSYQGVRSEMYRPAMEPQDYEMIEFFIKRFKLWIGLSKTKEFRHKVKFEGMESLPSRSSRNSKISKLPSANTELHYSGSTVSSGSMRSEELNILESPTSEMYDVEFYLDQLLPTVNSLLNQFDRVNKVTEDLYNLESPVWGIPGRRAWQSGPPLSADFSQRSAQTPAVSSKMRPKSEEGQGRLGSESSQQQMPVKKKAWQTEG
uniref:Polycystin 1, transient receptor potential channel interacting n=1 Tax=Latimeria chalumnae TaxID=7897 RepID=H3B277_LATCH